MWVIRFSGQENKTPENIFKAVSLSQRGKIQTSNLKIDYETRTIGFGKELSRNTRNKNMLI